MAIYIRRQILIAACIYLGQTLVGIGGGWSAPVIPKLQDPDQSPLPDLITDGQASLIGTLLYVGTIIGPYPTIYLSNTKGRKPCLFVGGATTLLAFVILALANSILMIYIGRILTGVGIGILATINLVYLGEIASTNIRGILLTITGIFNTVGILIVYSVGPYVPYAWTSWLGVVLSALYLSGLWAVPETPLFQILLGKETAATETLLHLGRPEDVAKITLLKDDAVKSNADWMQLFTVNTNRRALFITLPLNVLQQMSGFVAVMFFATTIFEFAGSSIEPNIATIIIGLTQLVASVVTPFLVERIGRKSLLLFSTVSCFVSLTVLGIFFWLDDIGLSDNIKWLPLVSLILFFLSFDFGFAIIPGTLLGEMFTSNVRSSGNIFVMTVSWLVGFGVSTAFGYMLPAVGGAITFWVFAAPCLLAFLFTVFFVPETKGKSLAEILDLLSK